MAKCANFMNQEAIDAALQEANERLMRQDRLDGIMNSEPQYNIGSNVCTQCGYGLGLETSSVMTYLEMVVGHPIKRVCYKEPEEQEGGRTMAEIEINDKFQVSMPLELIEAEAQYLKVVQPLLDKLPFYEMEYISHYLEDRLFALYRVERMLKAGE